MKRVIKSVLLNCNQRGYFMGFSSDMLLKELLKTVKVSLNGLLDIRVVIAAWTHKVDQTRVDDPGYI